MLADDLLEFDDADLEVINKQESVFMSQVGGPPSGPASDPRADLAVLQGSLAAVAEKLAVVSQEKVAKDGEVAMLRAKLSALELEKFETSKGHAAKLEALQQERQSLTAHWQREMERLRTEIKFQQVESIAAPPSRPSSVVIPPPHAHFSGSFADLLGAEDVPKRSRTFRAVPRDSSCEVDHLDEAAELLRLGLAASDVGRDCFAHVQLLGMLLNAVGCADQVVAHEDLLQSDRRTIGEIRKGIETIAFTTQNILLPLEYYFKKLSEGPAHIQTHYVVTVIEFLVCINEPVGPMILKGEAEFSEVALQMASEYLGDRTPLIGKSTRLLDALCQYLRRLPAGKGFSTVHQLLRIIKHVLYRAQGPTPACILAMLEEGVLLDKLDAFHQNYDEIVFDIAQLVQMVCHDARVPPLILEQIATHGCSLLDLFNDFIADKLEEAEYQDQISEELDMITSFLEGFVTDRIFPASVVFEPRTLRLFARQLANITHNERGLNVSSREADVKRLLQIVNTVALAERAPIVRLLDREIFCLMSAVFKVAGEGGGSPFPRLKPLVKDLKGLLEHEYVNIKLGKYSPVSLPSMRRRERPLTEEEELVMYEEMRRQNREE